MKKLVIVNEHSHRIEYLSPTVEGNKHDKKLADQSRLQLPPEATVIQDSEVRIVVEHVIASLKRCRVVKDIFRNTVERFDDLVMEIACGLHNFRLKFRNTEEVAKTTY